LIVKAFAFEFSIVKCLVSGKPEFLNVNFASHLYMCFNFGYVFFALATLHCYLVISIFKFEIERIYNERQTQ